MKDILRGNAVVGQSGGPTAAINATLTGVIKGALENECIETLYGMRNGIEGLMAERFVDLSALFADESEQNALIHTPAAALGSCRRKLPPPDSEKQEDIAVFERIFEVFERYSIKYFFYIGGNDSMDTVAKLSKYAARKGIADSIRIMGVPKTIDNDLAITDHAPGFGSAAKYVATTMTEIIRDCAVYTVKAVTIVEIMGRDAGWLTASSCVLRANGEPAPHMIYLPEREFSVEKFLDDIRLAQQKYKAVVVAVSEGIDCSGGKTGVVDAFGHSYLSGVGKYLENIARERIGCKVRSIELNVMQRCGSHIASLTDLEEAERIGAEAVKTAVEYGLSGVMMTFKRISNNPYRVDIVPCDVRECANKAKYFPVEWINDEGNNVTIDALNYFLPLIKGEPVIEYKNGIPVHFRLNQ